MVTNSMNESSSIHVVSRSSSSRSNHEDSPGSTSPTPKKHNMTSMQEFMQSFSFSTLLDPFSQPWVLVPDGSFLGVFDWVPRQLRVGPWSTCAICYVTAIWYISALTAVYFKSEISQPWWQSSSSLPSPMTDNSINDDWNSHHHHSSSLEYPQVGSVKWYYHAITFVWMAYVNHLLIFGPGLSTRAWATYTVQSWTLLWIRHLLCACAPISHVALQWAEYIRFPVACSTTITFVLWNTILAPFIYCIGMKTPEKKRDFVKFMFSFRLTQIHVFNIVYGIMNLAWASPRRQLEPIDLYFAILSVVLYMAWYLLLLDRLGIHLYAIFSPRAPGWIVVLIWTTLFLVYFATFRLWQRIMWPLYE
jgi:hypothetical protein